MKNPNVLISGAGVAGVTLAYWLSRHGFTPTVVERAPALRAGGYKVDIRGAALTVAERMGLLEEIRTLRTGVRRGTVVDATGKSVASMDGDTFGGRTHGDAEILRGDLHRLLYRRTAESVTCLFGDSITALRETPDGVEVDLASGRSDTFDLVIGADGLHSVTRALAFGPEERFVRDLGYRISICDVPNHLRLDREEVTYVGPGKTMLAYSTAGEEGAKAMFLFGSAELDGEPDGPAERRRALASVYAGEGWEVPRFVESAVAAPDLYYDSISQVHLDRWSAGRVALLGDAAHCASPASGQGTSLAMVGAYVLAGELAAAGGDHRGGFAAYEREMRPFAEANQRLGPANIKRMVMRTRGQVRLSMATLGLLDKLPGKDRIMAKAVAPIHRAATAITLRTY
ncbi:FAD-dependent monooxygenase [Actinoallomurus iriomotensis]|uniref:FAD-dependent oxidoreductase n=1 Tax=Actinoallomurus iriomotensis TaxID=478107 RepID=A0A9W6S4Q4_9ACTN|nr:FAD-dependent monooxygenase [Actinoallomurus iriomotensis]GLY87138.1 FAD-dependent oxidoreductase [Actinoallomurus iriomotensis]